MRILTRLLVASVVSMIAILVYVNVVPVTYIEDYLPDFQKSERERLLAESPCEIPTLWWLFLSESEQNWVDKIASSGRCNAHDRCIVSCLTSSKIHRIIGGGCAHYCWNVSG